MRVVACLSLLLLVAACVTPSPRADGGPPETRSPEVDAGLDAGTQQPAFEVHCEGTPAAGTTFVDATAAWDLASLTGNRLSVADLDGDGYPDLVVHAVTSNAAQPKQLPDGGTRWVRQLMNRPSADGTHRVFVDATDNGLFETLHGNPERYRSAQLAVFADVDNDGDLDAYSGTTVDPNHPETDPGDRSLLMLNDGTGHFSPAAPTVTPGPTERFPTSSATFTDVDLDGQIDLFVGHWYQAYGFSYLGVQAQLFHNFGGGFFADATLERGLGTDVFGYETFTNHRPAYGVTSCDLDGDGAPELLLSAYGRQGNLLYRNDGSGHFTDESASSTFSGDALLDPSDNENFKCWCTANQGTPSCANVAQPRIQCPTPATAGWSPGVDDLPWRNNGNTFTTWCGDVDGDGKNDLFNAEIHHWWAGSSSDSSQLLKNDSTSSVHFTRPGSEATGIVFPHPTVDWNEGGLMAAGGDLDDDGRLDLVVALSDYPDQLGRLYAQQGDGSFRDVTQAWQLQHPCMSGLAVADFDRDGDLDVLAGASTARDCAQAWQRNEVRLYENQAEGRHWLELELHGDGNTTNRAAIGARVTIEAGGQVQTREVQGGYGHYGMQNDLVVHVGLGACDGAKVTVRWPNATHDVTVLDAVQGDRFLELVQGEAAPRARP